MVAQNENVYRGHRYLNDRGDRFVYGPPIPVQVMTGDLQKETFKKYPPPILAEKEEVKKIPTSENAWGKILKLFQHRIKEGQGVAPHEFWKYIKFRRWRNPNRVRAALNRKLERSGLKIRVFSSGFDPTASYMLYKIA